MLAAAIAGLSTVMSLLSTHSDLIEAVIQLAENGKVDDATLLAAVKKALRDISDAQMHNELP